MKEENNNLIFLDIAIKWKKTLAIVFVSTIVLSVFFSSSIFIKPLYKSTAILYPVNIFSYSDESPTEQMLQVLLSNDLMFDVIYNENLFEKYEVNHEKKYAIDKIINKYQRRINIKRSQYESVLIEVKDRDPEGAKDIVNSIIDSYNKLVLRFLKERAEEILLIKKDLYLNKKNEVDSLKLIIDSILSNSNLMEYNILKESMKGYFVSINNDSRKNINSKNLPLDNSFDLFYYQTILENELEKLTTLKKDYEIAVSDVNKKLVFAEIIEKPFMPQKKVFPVRSLIVLVSLASTMFLAFLIILTIENIGLRKNDI